MKQLQAPVLIILIVILLFVIFAGISHSEERIVNDTQGMICFDEAKRLLAGYGISVNRNILLKVRPASEVQVQYITSGGRSISIGGYYQPFDPETIWIVSGETKSKTVADMVHELVHAWQSTNSPLQDRTVFEGFAMWCTYKALLQYGETEFAERLRNYKDPDYGDGLRLFLNAEAKGGFPAVIKYAKTAKKPSDMK